MINDLKLGDKNKKLDRNARCNSFTPLYFIFKHLKKKYVNGIIKIVFRNWIDLYENNLLKKDKNIQKIGEFLVCSILPNSLNVLKKFSLNFSDILKWYIESWAAPPKLSSFKNNPSNSETYNKENIK